jgi:hypothetical protein
MKYILQAVGSTPFPHATFMTIITHKKATFRVMLSCKPLMPFYVSLQRLRNKNVKHKTYSEKRGWWGKGIRKKERRERNK